MFWALVLGGAAVAAILAMLRGHNPLFWALSSLPGAALLTVIPPANGKALGERKRARREVGNKVGIFTSGVVVLLVIILSLAGVLPAL
ncbi:MAG: hypothetical protein EP329_08425 [Deltaproteobacteria bacterium]|nr:MAG: hypothetical protein EP329_08425 [Deltaproteobacteria bacterium]